MNKKLVIVLIIFLLITGLIGAFLLLSPVLEGAAQNQILHTGLQDWDALQAQWHNKTENSDPSTLHELPILYPELYAAMQEYNETIYRNAQCDFDSTSAYQECVIDLTEYGLEDNLIGKIQIPDIDVEMPLYLGATDSNLAKGLAHMGQTSLPIGGSSTNCVISGHRGWRSAAYLRDINLLEIGDVLYLENPWGTLEYRVCEFIIIQPHETEKLLIQPGRDLLTIVTCEPYGVGTHRYIVYFERHIPEELPTVSVPKDSPP